MKTRTLHIAKLIVMVWGLSAAIVSAEDIESIEKQDNQLEYIIVSDTRSEKPLYTILPAIGVVDKNEIGFGT